MEIGFNWRTFDTFLLLDLIDSSNQIISTIYLLEPSNPSLVPSLMMLLIHPHGPHRYLVLYLSNRLYLLLEPSNPSLVPSFKMRVLHFLGPLWYLVLYLSNRLYLLPEPSNPSLVPSFKMRVLHLFGPLWYLVLYLSNLHLRYIFRTYLEDLCLLIYFSAFLTVVQSLGEGCEVVIYTSVLRRYYQDIYSLVTINEDIYLLCLYWFVFIPYCK